MTSNYHSTNYKNTNNNFYNQKNKHSQNNKNEETFWEKYLNNFTDFKASLTLDYFEKNLKSELGNFSSSSLRNIYDTYLKISNLENEDFEIEFEILVAKIAYQENRKVSWKNILPPWFMKFFRNIYSEKLKKDKNKFKQFLEVLVAYQKYFNF